MLAYTVLSEGLQLILIYLFAALPQLHIYGCLAAMAAGEGLRLALSVKRIRLILNGNVKNAERECCRNKAEPKQSRAAALGKVPGNAAIRLLF